MSSRTFKKPSPIALGELQQSFEAARKQAAADEKALLRAQEARDASRGRLDAATAALRDATRTVLG